MRPRLDAHRAENDDRIRPEDGGVVHRGHHGQRVQGDQVENAQGEDVPPDQLNLVRFQTCV
ncbi:hypothetical protein TYRP_005403 [Tyrophagus putrescentiae]|nr:hypothetical protein TYRP_005403 [Tyrophagus putrescentiae]